jgi:hypothetical protein
MLFLQIFLFNLQNIKRALPRYIFKEGQFPPLLTPVYTYGEVPTPRTKL